MKVTNPDPVKPSARYHWLLPAGTGVLVGVLVGGSGVFVGVLVGGRGVLVGVLIVGVGVAVGLGSIETAESTWIRAIPVTEPPLLASLIDTPVVVSADRTASTEAPGSFDFKTAQAPVTWGAAIDVPLFNPYESPGTDEFIEEPGARSETKEAMFENHEIASADVVAPTLMAVEMHAGAPIALVYALFPDEITVATPADRSWST